MRRFITTLAILLVVIVAGMSALVLLVNPNDFRDYMAQQVEQRSGYRLALTGDLRWHVWPQLSILSGKMTLTAPGAAQPVISADNMRLDVNLLPLLSHQLAVKQVMLKGAVIRLTPDSEAQRPADAPVGPRDAAPPVSTQGWKFDIADLRVVDSLLVWQQASGEQLNVRDLNLQMSQNRHRQAHVELSSRINRDQRELRVTMNADMDVSRYPQHLSAVIQQLDYQLTGASLPTQGVAGQAKMQADWAGSNQAFTLKDLAISVNDSQLSGSVSGEIAERPQLRIDLHSPVLDMDSLLGLVSGGEENAERIAPQRSAPGPVISRTHEEEGVSEIVNAIDGEMALSADKLRWRGMDFQQVALKAASEQGVLTLNTLEGKAGKGEFSLPGNIDVRHNSTAVSLRPAFTNIAVAPLLKAFDMPASLSGDLSLTGSFTGTGLSVAAFKRDWQGRAKVSLSDAEMAGLNFQQMIQRAVERSSDRVHGPDEATVNSALQKIEGSATLDNGTLAFTTLKGNTSMIDYQGKGSVDLVNRQADFNFGITVIKGWQGEGELVRRLQQTPVPLRIYGPWAGLHYSLQVDQVLRQQLRDEAEKRLKNWAERTQNSETKSPAQKLLNKL
ncbi:outer membrane assembly protein AsmA [Pantoea sp. FN060301]|uniref:outer membrane assembly protein AsmA n=1 Tax=Pantoea sp. FN060301 TaxID=3420380 RepID=UPI003D175432